MGEKIKKEMKVEVAKPESPKKTKEPQKTKKELPFWNFPLLQRSVRAENLQEAIKKVNAK